MSKQEKKALVPVLRFPEFKKTGEWKEKPLSQICEVNPSTYDLPETFVYVDLESVEAGQLLRKNIISRDGAPSRAARLLKKGDVIFQMVRPYQKNNYFFLPNDDLDYVASTGYAQLRAHASNRYLFQYLHTDRFVNRVLERCTGSNYPAINSSDLSEILVEISGVEEQQKIADCLTSADELITAQTQRLDALRTHKKGLIQQLFPNEGETIPKLRFPEFQDMGEWEEKEIGEVFDVTRGYVLSMGMVNAEYSTETPFPVYSSQTKKKGLAGYYSEFLYENAITWTTDGANAGEVNYRKGKFYCTNVCGVLTNDKGQANPCIAALLNTVTRKHVSYVGNPKLMNGVMSKIIIPFPTLKEQHKIADCLASIDELINAQSDKVDALKNHKKGLMQQLFPAKDEVPG